MSGAARPCTTVTPAVLGGVIPHRRLALPATDRFRRVDVQHDGAGQARAEGRGVDLRHGGCLAAVARRSGSLHHSVESGHWATRCYRRPRSPGPPSRRRDPLPPHDAAENQQVPSAHPQAESGQKMAEEIAVPPKEGAGHIACFVDPCERGARAWMLHRMGDLPVHRLDRYSHAQHRPEVTRMSRRPILVRDSG